LIIGSAATLLYPQGIRLVIDDAVGRTPSQHFNRLTVALGAIALVIAMATACRYLFFSLAGERTVARLRLRLHQAILDQEIAFFDGLRTGELTNRLAADVLVLQYAVSGDISLALRGLAQALGGTVFMIYTAPRLALLMLALLPPLTLAAVWYGRRVRGLSRDVQDGLALAGGIAAESIGGIRTVRAFAAEPTEQERFARAVANVLARATRRVRAAGGFMAFTLFAAGSTAVFVLWEGGRNVMAGRVTAGQLTSFLVYAMIVALSLGSLADLWADLMRVLGAAERVFELIDRVPSIPRTGGLRPGRAQGGVAFEHVRFAYPGRPDVPVLDDVSLSVASGSVVALVGPSGAGKSTVAALLLRLYDVDEGRVLFDSYDVRALDPCWLRQRIGTVTQEPVLFSASIADNIRYGRPDAGQVDVLEAARAANVDEFAERLGDGYGTLVGERGVRLSGGQRQRIAIARALLKNPAMLVLDEATSALDAESEELVRSGIERLMRDRTTLVIAHRLSTLIGADHVLVLDRGRVVQSGSHAQLSSQEGLYRSLVHRQFSQHLPEGGSILRP
jgi:ATP-binding cassette subfamily B protein